MNIILNKFEILCTFCKDNNSQIIFNCQTQKCMMGGIMEWKGFPRIRLQ